MRITPEHLDAIRTHGRDAAPEECCGWMLLEDGAVVSTHRAHNVAPAEERGWRYDMDSVSLFAVNLVDDVNPDAVAIYHSHPMGMAYPSLIDVRQAPNPNWLYVIVARDDVRAWRIGFGSVVEEAVEVVEAVDA